MMIPQRGRRLFSTAAILMIVNAAAHMAGFLASQPDAKEQVVLTAMNNLRQPLGLGMNPSMLDMFNALNAVVCITFAGLGILSLVVAGTTGTTARLLRNVSLANAAWVVAYIAVSAIYRIPPPLIMGTVLEIFLVLHLATARRN